MDVVIVKLCMSVQKVKHKLTTVNLYWLWDQASHTCTHACTRYTRTQTPNTSILNEYDKNIIMQPKQNLYFFDTQTNTRCKW